MAEIKRSALREQVEQTRHETRRGDPQLVAEGHSSKEIALLLVISLKTVERHRANLLQKLGLCDRLELTRYAIRVGPIEP
jgi:DNA-binding NarL/FixJ family response regulator